jgi:hypothetical protein
LLAVLLAASFERNLWLLLLPATQLCVRLHDALLHDARKRAMLAAAELGLSVGLFVSLCVVLGWTPGAALATLRSPQYRAEHLAERKLAPACLAPLTALNRPANVYALRLWANYLIFRLPNLKVFVDGRNREYPDSVHEAAKRILSGAPDALHLLDVSHTDFVLVPAGWGDLPAIRGGAFHALASAPGCALYGRR